MVLAPDPVALDTSARDLKDGLNLCPKCGFTDTTKAGSAICAYCRNERRGERVEEQFGFGAGLDDLEGTIISSGARDIAADAAALRSFKRTGRARG